LPNGSDVTFAQMDLNKKNEISMRRQAAQKLKDFIN
jgi:inosine/xanthosine triphosphate pyrophosphatase family protein